MSRLLALRGALDLAFGPSPLFKPVEIEGLDAKLRIGRVVLPLFVSLVCERKTLKNNLAGLGRQKEQDLGQRQNLSERWGRRAKCGAKKFGFSSVCERLISPSFLRIA